jgi:ribosomal protein S18 acetylase RimI-like enzyme
MQDTNQIEITRISQADSQFIEQINPLLDHEWDIEQGERFLSNPDNALFVAYVDNQAVGFLTAYRLQRMDAKKAEVLLYEIGVAENFQKRGIGTALIESVKNWARNNGADEVWVLTYNSNIAAMALYSSTGGIEDEPGTRMFTYTLN